MPFGCHHRASRSGGEGCPGDLPRRLLHRLRARPITCIAAFSRLVAADRIFSRASQALTRKLYHSPRRRCGKVKPDNAECLWSGRGQLASRPRGRMLQVPISARTVAPAELSPAARRRTFAIISHPDAGKTTLTEKLLLFGGAIQMAGHVRARGEQRRTRSDWLDIERARGISVSSSVMTFEYGGMVFNLLDTPGHADFSEDTYRTLSAVDAAVMVIDAAKGIESQTRKLFEVCRLRDIPIVTFINKIDREGHDPLALLDEISSGLALDLTLLTWPLGMGVDFRAVLDIAGAKLLLPEEARIDAFGRTEQLGTIQALHPHADIEQRITQPALESLELCLSDLPPFDAKAFLEGHLSPVIFGSALKDF